MKVTPLDWNPEDAQNALSSNALCDYKTNGFVFRQCFGKYLALHDCQTCSEKDACRYETERSLGLRHGGD